MQNEPEPDLESIARRMMHEARKSRGARQAAAMRWAMCERRLRVVATDNDGGPVYVERQRACDSRAHTRAPRRARSQRRTRRPRVAKSASSASDGEPAPSTAPTALWGAP
jgi:hypothetical protein